MMMARARVAWILFAGFATIGIWSWCFYYCYYGRPAANAIPQEVNLKGLGSFEMDQRHATIDDIPMAARKLDGKRVKIIGEVWNSDNVNDIRHFQLGAGQLWRGIIGCLT
jgi:hypothetical protein